MKRRILMMSAVTAVAVTLLMQVDARAPGYRRGLVAHYFRDKANWDGNWPDSMSAPSVSAADWTFTEYSYSRVEPLVNHLFVKRGWFTVRWVGYFDPQPPNSADKGRPAPAEVHNYHFQVLADDGCRLMIDGRTVIDDWVPCSEKSPRALRKAPPLSLRDGKHRIVVEYFQGQSLRGGDHDPIKVYWSCPSRKVPRQIVPASHFWHTTEDTKSAES